MFIFSQVGSPLADALTSFDNPTMTELQVGLCSCVDLPLWKLFQLFQAGRDHFHFQLGINLSSVCPISLHSLQIENKTSPLGSSLLPPDGQNPTLYHGGGGGI